MNYRIINQATRESLDAIELHVLARAYQAAWQRMHDCKPLFEHAIPDLNLLIDFLPEPQRTEPGRAGSAGREPACKPRRV